MEWCLCDSALWIVGYSALGQASQLKEGGTYTSGITYYIEGSNTHVNAWDLWCGVVPGPGGADVTDPHKLAEELLRG